jgi:hypothetical protein
MELDSEGGAAPLSPEAAAVGQAPWSHELPAELLLNALMLFAVQLGRVRRRGRRRRLGLNDAVWQGIGLI